jgi:hypothetical protein
MRYAKEFKKRYQRQMRLDAAFWPCDAIHVRVHRLEDEIMELRFPQQNAPLALEMVNGPFWAMHSNYTPQSNWREKHKTISSLSSLDRDPVNR